MLAANSPHTQVCHRGIFQLQKSPKSVTEMVLEVRQDGKLRGVRILSSPKWGQRERNTRSCSCSLPLDDETEPIVGAKPGGEVAEVV